MALDEGFEELEAVMQAVCKRRWEANDARSCQRKVLVFVCLLAQVGLVHLHMHAHALQSPNPKFLCASSKV